MKASADPHNQINVNRMLLQRYTLSYNVFSYKDNINILYDLFSTVWIHRTVMLIVNAKDFQPTQGGKSTQASSTFDSLTASITSIFYAKRKVESGVDQAFFSSAFYGSLEVQWLTESPNEDRQTFNF